MNTDRERTAADELDELFDQVRRADADLHRAESYVERAARASTVAHLRYKRKALWIRADELRHELAEVENEALSIQV